MTDAEIVCAEIRAAEVPMTDALGAALDRLERDAERYRCLRKRAKLGFDGPPIWSTVLRFDALDSQANTLDSCVDALMLAVGDA